MCAPRLPPRSRPVVARLSSLLWASTLALWPAAVHAGDPEQAGATGWDGLSVTALAGFDWSRGDYGLSEDSTLYYVPLGLIVDRDRWRFRITLPFLVSDGPTTVRVGGGRTDSERSSGLGEVVTSGSYLFDPFVPGLPYVELGLQVTWPTRTRRELGIGAFAFEPRVDLFQRWGRVTPFASFGRTFYTDALDDRFFASVGASVDVTERLAVGAAFDWFEDSSRSTVDDTPDSNELVPFLALAVSPRWSVNPYAVFGLTEGSPDYGCGLSISFTPLRPR